MLSKLKSDGGDLRFTDDSTTPVRLPIDKVAFAKTSGGIQLWTRYPSVASSAKVHVWGDASSESQPAVSAAFGRNAVWSDKEVVIHVGTGTNGVFSDSTGNNHGTTLTTGSSINTSSVGHPFGGHWADFSGGQTLTLSNSGQMLNGSAFTVSYWIKQDGAHAGRGVFGNRYKTPSDEYIQGVSSGAQIDVAGGSQTDVVYTPTTTAKFVIITSDASGMEVFENGVSVGTASGQAPLNSASTQSYRVGNYYDNRGFRGLDGKVSEIKAWKSKATLSSASIEYSNQSAVGAWFTATDVSGGPFTLETSVILSTMVIYSPEVAKEDIPLVLELPLVTTVSQLYTQEVSKSTPRLLELPAIPHVNLVYAQGLSKGTPLVLELSFINNTNVIFNTEVAKGIPKVLELSTIASGNVLYSIDISLGSIASISMLGIPDGNYTTNFLHASSGSQIGQYVLTYTGNVASVRLPVNSTTPFKYYVDDAATNPTNFSGDYGVTS